MKSNAAIMQKIQKEKRAALRERAFVYAYGFGGVALLITAILWRVLSWSDRLLCIVTTLLLFVFSFMICRRYLYRKFGISLKQ